MARFLTRALPLASRSSSPLHSPISSSSPSSRLPRSPISPSSPYPISPHASFSSSPFDGSFPSSRDLQNSRMRRGSEEESSSEKKPEIFLQFLVMGGLRTDPELGRVLEMFGPNVLKAMDVAFDGLHCPGYKTRYSYINDVSKFEKVELSLLFANDDCMQKRNEALNGVNATMDVLRVPRHIPDPDNRTLLLGDIVISVETAARQAEERGHTLLDEFRILMVHGLLHLLGFDHKKSEEAEKEMQKVEEHVLKSLGWKGEGLITNKKNAEGGRTCFENSWMKSPSKEKKPQLIIKFLAKDKLCEGPEVMRMLAMLEENVHMAMRVAFDGLHFSGYKTRDTSVSDVSKFEKVELSLCFSDDNGMQEHNKAWKGVDATTGVLSMSRHIRLDNQTLLLGDIVISVETAARQAEERGHTLLDEFRIQMVHGLLHLLGFDPKLSEEAEKEMQEEEERVLKRLGWEGKGLIANKRRS